MAHYRHSQPKRRRKTQNSCHKQAIFSHSKFKISHNAWVKPSHRYENNVHMSTGAWCRHTRHTRLYLALDSTRSSLVLAYAERGFTQETDEKIRGFQPVVHGLPPPEGGTDPLPGGIVKGHREVNEQEEITYHTVKTQHENSRFTSRLWYTIFCLFNCHKACGLSYCSTWHVKDTK